MMQLLAMPALSLRQLVGGHLADFDLIEEVADFEKADALFHILNHLKLRQFRPFTNMFISLFNDIHRLKKVLEGVEARVALFICHIIDVAFLDCVFCGGLIIRFKNLSEHFGSERCKLIHTFINEGIVLKLLLHIIKRPRNLTFIQAHFVQYPLTFLNDV